jgi:Leucine-rich repeat (LRR) protein
MKQILLVLFVFALGSSAFSQQSVPIFKEKSDSVQYATIQGEIMAVFKTERDSTSAKKLDSLFRLQANLREKIIGFKTIYVPGKEFTAYGNLENGTVQPSSVTKLSVTGTQKKLSKKIFECTHLEELELIDTHIKKLPRKLGKLKSLKGIYVYNNQSPRQLKLSRNAVTKELLLRGMEEKSLPKSYKKFTALEELDLSKNIGLEHFPDIYQNKKLVKLNLIENVITLSDLKPVPNSTLKDLNLQKNKIQKVPDAIGSFTELKKLTLNYNQIEEVSPAITNLTSLEELSFYQNKLKSIPTGVYQLSSLKTIDLYYNQIERIEPTIANLTTLEILYLSNNQLIAVPEEISKLPKLRELYLSNNKLFMLPESFSQLKTLQVLRVNNNNLSDFPEFVFELPAIENIDVSSNSIRLIPDQVTAIPKLNLIALSNNPVNKEIVNMAKLIEDLTAKGTIVHQNSIEITKE